VTVTSYSGAPVAIPDGDLTGVDIPFTVSASGPLAGVRFRFDGSACSTLAGATTVGVDHTWVGDLAFTLIAPSGKAVTLLDAAGGASNNGHNICQTVLDDSAPMSIQPAVRAARRGDRRHLDAARQRQLPGRPGQRARVLARDERLQLHALSVT
jgi:hypothetical protein